MHSLLVEYFYRKAINRDITCTTLACVAVRIRTAHTDTTERALVSGDKLNLTFRTHVANISAHVCLPAWRTLHTKQLEI